MTKTTNLGDKMNELMDEFQEKKIINAERAVPYTDVVATITDLVAMKLGQVGFRVRGSKGILELEYAGKKVIILVEEG